MDKVGGRLPTPSCRSRESCEGRVASPGESDSEGVGIRSWKHSAILKVKLQIPCQIIYPRLLEHIFRRKKMYVQSRNPNIRTLCGSGGEPLGMQAGKTIAANGPRGKPRAPMTSWLFSVPGDRTLPSPLPTSTHRHIKQMTTQGKSVPIDNTHCHMLLRPHLPNVP